MLQEYEKIVVWANQRLTQSYKVKIRGLPAEWTQELLAAQRRVQAQTHETNEDIEMLE